MQCLRLSESCGRSGRTHLQFDGESPQLAVLNGGGERRQVVTEGRDGVDGELRRLERLLRRLVRLEADPLVRRRRRVVVVVRRLQILLRLGRESQSCGKVGGDWSPCVQRETKQGYKLRDTCITEDPVVLIVRIYRVGNRKQIGSVHLARFFCFHCAR